MATAGSLDTSQGGIINISGNLWGIDWSVAKYLGADEKGARYDLNNDGVPDVALSANPIGAPPASTSPSTTTIVLGLVGVAILIIALK